VVVDATLHLLPIPARWIERAQGVIEYLVLRPAQDKTEASA
jgi:hypothetical protein